MADIWTVQHGFWSGFSLPATEEHTPLYRPPGEELYPRVTYESFSGGFGHSQRLQASLWYRAGGWEAAKKKADEIRAALSEGGVSLPFDGGLLWITLPAGTAFARPAESGARDRGLRRMLLCVEGHCYPA